MIGQLRKYELSSKTKKLFLSGRQRWQILLQPNNIGLTTGLWQLRRAARHWRRRRPKWWRGHHSTTLPTITLFHHLAHYHTIPPPCTLSHYSTLSTISPLVNYHTIPPPCALSHYSTLSKIPPPCQSSHHTTNLPEMQKAVNLVTQFVLFSPNYSIELVVILGQKGVFTLTLTHYQAASPL